MTSCNIFGTVYNAVITLKNSLMVIKNDEMVRIFNNIYFALCIYINFNLKSVEF